MRPERGGHRRAPLIEPGQRVWLPEVPTEAQRPKQDPAALFLPHRTRATSKRHRLGGTEPRRGVWRRGGRRRGELGGRRNPLSPPERMLLCRARLSGAATCPRHL
ncbi:hypothetical protein DPEC_G00070010 [Dallia pectoralis]|uniref:Uncharacterized protein n=1 Tax=Dallia pectoralis TaxID=75939 RepID=A0ACC2H227_DALPE|nr:hypothetical protein DPEC_G00070010 [Dallia pectoralis]